MKNMKSWIKAAGIRAIKTVAQTAVATIGTSAVIGDVKQSGFEMREFLEDADGS